MIRNITRDIYYFFYDILIFLNNLKSTQNFLLLLPRFVSLILKKVFIYDKKNKKIFIQKIRNRYDLLTIYEIFSEESYNLTKFECWKEVYKNYLQIIDNTISTLDKLSKEMIPSLPTGSCVVTGTSFELPVLMQVDRLDEGFRPDSEDVDLEVLWS